MKAKERRVRRLKTAPSSIATAIIDDRARVAKVVDDGQAKLDRDVNLVSAVCHWNACNAARVDALVISVNIAIVLGGLAAADRRSLDVTVELEAAIWVVWSIWVMGAKISGNRRRIACRRLWLASIALPTLLLWVCGVPAAAMAVAVLGGISTMWALRTQQRAMSSKET